VARNLVIVESPAKAKTINKYLGKDYQVKGGGIISVLMKPGNLEITAECRACHAAKASSDPG